MLVPLGGLFAGTHVCLTAITRDGKYWARLQFDVPPAHDETGFLKPRPDWRFLDAVKKMYSRSEFAAVGRLGAACDIAESPEYVPIVFAGDRDVLTAAFNSVSAIKLTAELAIPDQRRLVGDCHAVGHDVLATGFDVICTFDVRSAHATRSRAILEVHRDELTGPRRPETFAVRLP
jgi:hypothetical protein